MANELINLFEGLEEVSKDAAKLGVAAGLQQIAQDMADIQKVGLLGVPYSTAKKYFPEAAYKTPEEWSTYVQTEKSKIVTAMDLYKQPLGWVRYNFGSDALDAMKQFAPKDTSKPAYKAPQATIDAGTQDSEIESQKQFAGLTASALSYAETQKGKNGVPLDDLTKNIIKTKFLVDQAGQYLQYVPSSIAQEFSNSLNIEKGGNMYSVKEGSILASGNASAIAKIKYDVMKDAGIDVSKIRTLQDVDAFEQNINQQLATDPKAFGSTQKFANLKAKMANAITAYKLSSEIVRQAASINPADQRVAKQVFNIFDIFKNTAEKRAKLKNVALNAGTGGKQTPNEASDTAATYQAEGVDVTRNETGPENFFGGVEDAAQRLKENAMEITDQDGPKYNIKAMDANGIESMYEMSPEGLAAYKEFANKHGWKGPLDIAERLEIFNELSSIDDPNKPADPKTGKQARKVNQKLHIKRNGNAPSTYDLTERPKGLKEIGGKRYNVDEIYQNNVNALNNYIKDPSEKNKNILAERKSLYDSWKKRSLQNTNDINGQPLPVEGDPNVLNSENIFK